MSKLKRLFFDIETSPNFVLSWRTGYKINIDHDNITRERAIICIGWKWEHGSVAARWWGRDQDDRIMLSDFLKVANEADELVAHNGDRFDLPWIVTRCAFHGLPTFPSYKTVDTLQWARRRFYFNSNRLDYIGGYLGIGRKLKTDFGLWKAVVLQNDRDALARMVRYCKRDVVLLEKVWRKLAAHVPHKTHAGVIAGRGRDSCPRCGHTESISRGRWVTGAGTTKARRQCRKCHGHFSVAAKRVSKV